MLDLPPFIITTFSHFSSLFSRPVYRHISTLFGAHIISKGRRTIADLLRAAWLKNIKNFSKYHRVFSKASWTTFKGSRILFDRLLLFTNSEVQVLIDGTVERRKGTKIKFLGRKRDAVASSKQNKVLCIGQEWLISALSVQFPWTSTRYACPFLSILMPPKTPLRSTLNPTDLKERRHKTVTEWAGQVAYLLRKWLEKGRKCSLIGDGAFACLHLAHACRKNGIGLISRLRLDARIFEYPPEQKKRGRPSKTGHRIRLGELLKDTSIVWEKAKVMWYEGVEKEVEYIHQKSIWHNFSHEPIEIHWVLVRDPEGNLDPTAFFSTDLAHDPIHIIESFVSRWKLETTFEEMRRHLGFETQRHWSDQAVDRITPCLMGSFSIICLCGAELYKQSADKINPQTTSWYNKTSITFSDVLCAIRIEILERRISSMSWNSTTLKKKHLKEWVHWAAAA